MISRLSRLPLRTLREDPSEAEALGHRLLLRAGYIRRQGSGIFSWLPLGLRVLRRVEQVVREEMRRAGAEELLLPALLPAEPYRRTRRWEEYGENLFRLRDRREADHVLAPTHEEIITLLLQEQCDSYRSLPQTLYQIQTKYRDEARPRAGLLRSREFSMKDAYSFDLDAEGLEQSYRKQRDAYEEIFRRLGVSYVIVNADAGAMGGSRSEEFLHPSAAGEDTFVEGPEGFAANAEAFRLVPPPPLTIDPETAAARPLLFFTPKVNTIGKLVDLVNDLPPPQRQLIMGGPEELSAGQTLKCLILKVSRPSACLQKLLNPDADSEAAGQTSAEKQQIMLCLLLPGDRELDEKRAEVTLGEYELAKDDDFAAYPQLHRGFISPCLARPPEGHSADSEPTPAAVEPLLGCNSSTGIPLLADPRIVSGSSWITGGGLADYHLAQLTVGRDFTPDASVDVAALRDGDPGPTGPVRLSRGIEVGHVFQLGTKYAEAFDFRVPDESGVLRTVTMGCYGIGVSRLVQIVAEATADSRGLCWPETLAPYDVQLIPVAKGAEAVLLLENLAEKLAAAGQEVLIDDRPRLSVGVKFADAELLGIPRLVVIGRDAASGQVELWERRSGERRLLPQTEALAELLGHRKKFRRARKFRGNRQWK